jgi:hypothetical protein
MAKGMAVKSDTEEPQSEDEASFSTSDNFSYISSPNSPTTPSVSSLIPQTSVYSTRSQYGYDVPSSQQYDASLGFFSATDDVRYTPSILGWTKDTELLKLYKFVVPKSKLPYFELLEQYTPTYETPFKVYLDAPK